MVYTNQKCHFNNNCKNLAAARVEVIQIHALRLFSCGFLLANSEKKQNLSSVKQSGFVLRDLVKDDEKKFKNYEKKWKCYIKPTIGHYRQILDTSFSSTSTAYSGSGVIEPREFRF